MRDSKLLRLICLLISLFMAISLLGACSQNKTKDASSTPSDTADDGDYSDDDDYLDDDSLNDSDDDSQDDYFDDGSGDDLSDDDWGDDDEEDDDGLSTNPTETLNVYNGEAPISTHYRGISGSIYHAFGHMKDDATGRVYTDEMMDIELSRLIDSGIRFCRSAFYIEWIWDRGANGGAGAFSYNTNRANYFYDYCQSLQDRGAYVALQVGWHINAYTHIGVGNMGAFPYITSPDEYPQDCANETAGYDFSQHEDPAYQSMAKSALRVGYAYSELIKNARARGIYSIKYLQYFVETSYEYKGDPTSPNYGHGGEQPAEYCFIVDRIQYKLKQEGVYNLVGHIGPNQSNQDGEGLARYCLEHYGRDMFDIWTQHAYPKGASTMSNIFYDISNPMWESYMQCMKDHGIAGVEEFWIDEYYAGESGVNLGGDDPWSGLQSVVGAIAAQQNGIDNISLWQIFDQLWTDRDSTSGEFINGIHACGSAPSLFVSSIPRSQYYSVSLFGKYNGYENGKIYRTNLHELQAYASDIHVGATQLKDGSWTVSVVNCGVDPYDITVNFDKAINQTLYRHVNNVNTNIPSTAAHLADADKTFVKVKDKFTDTVDGGCVVIYTGVKG